jgi:hypothetical protein
MSVATLPEETVRRVQELGRPWGGLPVPRPRFEGASLVNVAVSLLRDLGDESPAGPLPPLLPEYGLTVDDGDAAVLVVVDSFGWNCVEALVSHPEDPVELAVASLLAERAHPLTTVFPTTTAASLVSLSTAAAPGSHGILAYIQYLPQYGCLVNTLRMAPAYSQIPPDLFKGPSFDPQEWVRLPTLFRRLGTGAALTERPLVDSGFTRVLYDGAEIQGHGSLSELSVHLEHCLERQDSQRPRLIMVYWSALDTALHLEGPDPRLMKRELGLIFHALAAAVRPVAPRHRVRFLVTGDHGHIETPRERCRLVHSDPEWVALLARPPSGEGRASFLRAREGRLLELRSHLSAHLPADWVCLETRRLIHDGFLGPPPHHPELLERFGDLVVLPPRGATLAYRPPGFRGPELAGLLGGHGGLTPEELLVPLVTFSGEELVSRVP